MEINCDFSELENLRQKMGAEITNLSIDTEITSEVRNISFELKKGLEIDISQLDIIGGVYSFQGEQLVVHIYETYKEKGHVVGFKFEANYEAIKKSNIVFVQRSFLQQSTIKILDDIIIHMPKNKPRYLMGVGTPGDILGAVKRGVDMFDCVLPTRSGRTGLAFTWNGRINIRNAKYKKDNSPLDKNAKNFQLFKYSKNYLNHLFNTNEMLGSMLLTLNNINFYQELMSTIRKNIKNGTFSKFHDKYIDKL